MQGRIDVMNEHWHDCDLGIDECKICFHYKEALVNFRKCWELLSSMES